MQGKLDFNESLRTRVGKLQGAPVSILQEVADNTEDKKLLSIIEKGIIIKNDRKDK